MATVNTGIFGLICAVLCRCQLSGLIQSDGRFYCRANTHQGILHISQIDCGVRGQNNPVFMVLSTVAESMISVDIAEPKEICTC